MKNSKFKNQTTGSRPGFTLVELLVVILLIAVLVALSFVGVKKVKAMADKSNSIRNISQLQIANITYATDNNGKCVPIRANDENGNATRWFQDLDFLANLTGRPTDGMRKNDQTIIPLDMMDPKVVRARNTLYNRIYTSYGMNDTGLTLGAEANLSSSHNLNQISDPARSMAFATATDYRVTFNSRYKWDFNNPNDSKTSNGEIAYRHGDKILAVYFDGHVGELTKSDMENIDKSGGKNNAFWRPKQ